MVTTRRRRIAVTGGGTAGHILSALDFLEAYRREFGAEGFFLGCAAGLESRLVPARGVRLEIVPGLPWARQGWRGRWRAVASLPGAIRAARRVLRRENVDLVIGAGGYASIGACLAARTLGVPFVIHESNVDPGLANRLLSRFAALVCVGFEETARGFGRGAVVTGIPAAIPESRPAGTPHFVVLGGSEGSPVLNLEAPRLFAELHRRGVVFSVRHIVGFGDPASVECAYAAAGVEARVDRFVDDMAPVYAGATMAIAAAGARTLAELSAAAVPSLLAPTPGAARDHQAENARCYGARTGAGLIPDSWDAAALATRIQAVLGNPEELRILRQRASAWGKPQAAAELVRACERLIASRFSSRTQSCWA